MTMDKKSKACHWEKSTSLKEETISSLDVLRESSVVACDFLEKLAYADLRNNGNCLNLVKTKSYKVKDLDEMQIDDLKKEMLDKVPTNAGTFTWMDTHKILEKKYQRGTGFDFDLYFRCSEPIQHHPYASPINVGQLLRPAGDNIELIQSNRTLEQFRATPITHKTLLWMEMCPDSFSVRHKLYQLFRALIVLRPSDDEKVIGILYLNDNFDYVKTVCYALRQNAFVTRRAKDCNMELALAWTKHRNLCVSMHEVTKGLSELNGTISGLKGTVDTFQQDISTMRGEISSLHEDFSTLHEDMSSLHEDMSRLHEEMSRLHEEMSSLHEDMSSLRDDMSTLQENVEKKLDRLEQRLEEILNRLPKAQMVNVTFTTMVTIIMFLLWEAIELKFWMV